MLVAAPWRTKRFMYTARVVHTLVEDGGVEWLKFRAGFITTCQVLIGSKLRQEGFASVISTQAVVFVN